VWDVTDWIVLPWPAHLTAGLSLALLSRFVCRVTLVCLHLCMLLLCHLHAACSPLLHKHRALFIQEALGDRWQCYRVPGCMGIPVYARCITVCGMQSGVLQEYAHRGSTLGEVVLERQALHAASRPLGASAVHYSQPVRWHDFGCAVCACRAAAWGVLWQHALLGWGGLCVRWWHGCCLRPVCTYGMALGLAVCGLV
jgi:hypothetical protein